MREGEREKLLHDAELEGLRNAISSAKKYSEGFALRFNLENDKEFYVFELFIKKIMAFRE